MKRLKKNVEKNCHVGLDIGSSRVVCAIVTTDVVEKRIKLLGLGEAHSTGIKKGCIIHRDRTIEEIEKALADAEMMANTKVSRVVLSTTGEHIRGINTQGAIAVQKGAVSALPVEHEITKQDVHRVLELAKAISLPADRDILHVMPQEFLIDTMDGIKDPVGMTGRRLEAKVHLITMAVTAAKNLLHCVEELGLEVEGLVFQALAASLSALDDDEKNLGVALVDIGAGTTDVAIYHEGGLRHTAVLGIGASSITNDIAVMLQIGLEEAEKIKKTYASAKASMSSTDLEFELPVKNGDLARKISEHELSRYVEARMIEILQLILREISRADIKEKLTYGVVFTGGGAQLRNLVPLAQEILNMPVRIGHPKGLSGAVDIASTPEYATCLGLAQWISTYRDYLPVALQEKTLKRVVDKVTFWIKEFF